MEALFRKLAQVLIGTGIVALTGFIIPLLLAYRNHQITRDHFRKTLAFIGVVIVLLLMLYWLYWL